jgi:hypothetical protein
VHRPNSQEPEQTASVSTEDRQRRYRVGRGRTRQGPLLIPGTDIHQKISAAQDHTAMMPKPMSAFGQYLATEYRLSRAERRLGEGCGWGTDSRWRAGAIRPRVDGVYPFVEAAARTAGSASAATSAKSSSFPDHLAVHRSASPVPRSTGNASPRPQKMTMREAAPRRDRRRATSARSRYSGAGPPERHTALRSGHSGPLSFAERRPSYADAGPSTLTTDGPWSAIRNAPTVPTSFGVLPRPTNRGLPLAPTSRSAGASR